MIYRILILSIFFFSSNNIHGNIFQINNSLLKIETKIKKGAFVNNNEIEKIIDAASKSQFNEGISKGYYLLGLNEYYKSNFETASIYLNNSLKINHETNVTKAECLRYLGKIKTIEGNLLASIKKLIESKKIYSILDENLKLKDHQILNNDIGYYYLQIEDYNNAYKLFNENLKKSKFDEVVADTYMLLAITSRTQEEYEKALKYYEKAKELFIKTKVYTNIKTIDLNTGILLYETEKYNQAIIILNDVLLKSKKDSFNLGITKSHIYLSKIYSKLKDYKKAQQNLNYAIKYDSKIEDYYDYKSAKADFIISKGNHNEAIKYIDSQINDSLPYHIKIELLEKLSNSYNIIGDYTKAFDIQKKITSVNDKYYKNLANSQLQTQKIVTENEILEKEVSLLKMQESKRNGAFVFSILILILLTAFIIFYFFKKKHTNKLKDELYNSQILLLEKEKLNQILEIEYKNKEITNMSLFISEKNQALSDIKKKIKNISTKNIETKNELKETLYFIDNIINNSNSITELDLEIETNKRQFEEKLTLKYPDLIEREIRVACLIMIGFTSKQISSHLNITRETVDNIRYILRKKLNIPKSDSILNYLKTNI